MGSLVKDHYALGLHPRGYDLLLQIIDLELGLSDSPESVYILGFILDGWSQREVARHLNVHHSLVQKHIKKARGIIGDMEII